MKEMIYSTNVKRELLDSGKCMNYNYYILNLGVHPTAYIEIPKDHKYYLKHYDDIDIDVHGGLTYSEDYLNLENEKITNCWFIGWDYAHYEDYSGYEELIPNGLKVGGKKWTTKEIQEEVYDVCKQLKKVEQ